MLEELRSSPRAPLRRAGAERPIPGAGAGESPWAVTLDQVGRDRLVKVVRVDGARQLVHRLAGLGIVPGAVVTVLRPRGPGLVSVNGTRIAIGNQAARSVTVTDVGT